MKTKTIIDTGVLSRYFTKSKIEPVMNTCNKIGEENFITNPAIYMEIRKWLSGFTFTPKERYAINKFIAQMPVVHIETKISKKAIELHSKNINADVADTLIAATCLVKKLPLCSRNIKHFEPIKGLKLIKAIN